MGSGVPRAHTTIALGSGQLTDAPTVCPKDHHSYRFIHTVIPTLTFPCPSSTITTLSNCDHSSLFQPAVGLWTDFYQKLVSSSPHTPQDPADSPWTKLQQDFKLSHTFLSSTKGIWQGVACGPATQSRMRCKNHTVHLDKEKQCHFSFVVIPGQSNL